MDLWTVVVDTSTHTFKTKYIHKITNHKKTRHKIEYTIHTTARNNYTALHTAPLARAHRGLEPAVNNGARTATSGGQRHHTTPPAGAAAPTAAAARRGRPRNGSSLGC